MPDYKECPKCLHCDCEDWKNDFDKFVTAFKIMFLHGYGSYKGKKFIYCPWCAKLLKRKEYNENV